MGVYKRSIYECNVGYINTEIKMPRSDCRTSAKIYHTYSKLNEKYMESGMAIKDRLLFFCTPRLCGWQITGVSGSRETEVMDTMYI